MKRSSRRETARRYTGFFLALLLLSAGLTACGASRRAKSMSYREAPAEGGYNMAATVAETTAAAMAADYDMEAAEEAYASGDAGFRGLSTGTSEDNVDTTDIPGSRKLIRNVDMAFETTEFDSFTVSIEKRTVELGGYVESSDVSGNRASQGALRHAFYALRIPTARLDSFLAFAEEGANLLRKYENTQDITLQYHDIESRKKALETERDRLLELLAKAESVDAVIAIESRLSDIRYQLEGFESNLRIYDNKVDYSTVTVDIAERRILTPTAKAGFTERIWSGFQENLEEVTEDLIDFVVWFLSNIPGILVIVLVLWIVFMILRKLVRAIVKKHADHPRQPLFRKKQKKQEAADALAGQNAAVQNTDQTQTAETEGASREEQQ